MTKPHTTTGRKQVWVPGASGSGAAMLHHKPLHHTPAHFVVPKHWPLLASAGLHVVSTSQINPKHAAVLSPATHCMPAFAARPMPAQVLLSHAPVCGHTQEGVAGGFGKGVWLHNRIGNTCQQHMNPRLRAKGGECSTPSESQPHLNPWGRICR